MGRHDPLKIADIVLLKVSVLLENSDDVMTHCYASHLRICPPSDDTYTSVSMAWSLVTLEK